MRKLLKDIQRRLSWVINEVSNLKTKFTTLTSRVDVVEVTSDMQVKGARVYPAGVTANAVTFSDTETTNGSIYLTPFFVPGKMAFSKIGIHTLGELDTNIVAGVYKYDYANDQWTKITQVGPFTTGATGIHSITVTGSLITIEQGLYATALTADGAQTDVTGYDVNSLGNFSGQMWGGTARSAYYFYIANSYNATLPTSLAQSALSTSGSAGDDIPGCFLLLA